MKITNEITHGKWHWNMASLCSKFTNLFKFRYPFFSTNGLANTCWFTFANLSRLGVNGSFTNAFWGKKIKCWIQYHPSIVVDLLFANLNMRGIFCHKSVWKTFFLRYELFYWISRNEKCPKDNWNISRLIRSWESIQISLPGFFRTDALLKVKKKCSYELVFVCLTR